MHQAQYMQKRAKKWYHFHHNTLNREYYSDKFYLNVAKNTCCCIQILALVIIYTINLASSLQLM